MRRPAALLLLAAGLACGCGADIDITVGSGDDTAAGGSGRDRREGHVTSVTDGDTFRIGDERVRLIGVDTPETRKPGAPVQCFGKKASAFTERILAGEDVVLTFDVERTDRYGRTLAYVSRKRDGFDLNAALVERGYAMPLTVPPNVARADRYRELGAEARDRGRGLWRACRS